MDPDQVILQLASEVGEMLLTLEVGEDLVAEEEPRLASGHEAAEAREVVQLPNGPREGRLSTLVRSGHHEDALAVVQIEVVGDHRRLLLGDQLLREREIERVLRGDRLRLAGDVRVAEAQPRRADPADVLEIGDVELHFPVE